MKPSIEFDKAVWEFRRQPTPFYLFHCREQAADHETPNTIRQSCRQSCRRAGGHAADRVIRNRLRQGCANVSCNHRQFVYFHCRGQPADHETQKTIRQGCGSACNKRHPNFIDCRGQAADFESERRAKSDKAVDKHQDRTLPCRGHAADHVMLGHRKSIVR